MQPFELQADLDQLLVLRPAVGHLLQLRVFLQRRVQVDLGTLGNELGDGVRLVVGKVQDARHVADHRARLQRAERDDLPDLVLPVLPGDVGDDLVPAPVAEIDVEIGHGHALGVEEALEEQAVLQRIDVGDLEAVGHEGARARAPARAHGDAVLLGVMDEVPDDEEVAGEAHGGDDGKLVLEPLRRLGRHRVESLREPCPGELREVALRGGARPAPRRWETAG